jgi:hypothetical protein
VISPPEGVRIMLGKCRAVGDDFREAWTVSIAVALSDMPDPDGSWREALEATRDAWRRAYELEPATALDQAVAELRDGRGLAELIDNGCGRCGAAIPTSRDREGVPARYCSDRCRRLAAYERERNRPRLRQRRKGSPPTASRKPSDAGVASRAA